MSRKFFTILSTITSITAVTFCFSVVPASAARVNVVRNCATFNPNTGRQLRLTARGGMNNLIRYYRARSGTPMAVLLVWDRKAYRNGTIAIPIVLQL